MNKRLEDVFAGREDNYMLPFYWQHGDHYEKIPEQIERIYNSGCRAFCVESRPHNDFCGRGWWRDMDLILSEAARRNMKVWILDDDHFPTGHAAGQVKNRPDLRAWQLIERHVDVTGPVCDSLLLVENTDADNILIGVYMYERTGEDENCFPDGVCLTEQVKDGFLRFSVPCGCYRIFFLYKSRRGNSKADYIDMLREESVKLLIDSVYEPHYERYKKYFGNTVAGFFSDEPSFCSTWFGAHVTDPGMYDYRTGMPGMALPWSDKTADMMSRALCRDALPLLPALWFDHGEDTGKIRHAYMDATTKLYRDCFTRQLGGWCEEHGVEYIGHIIEDMNSHARLGYSAGHYFRSLDGQHMSGVDIVLHQIIPGMSEYIHTSSTFGNRADPAFFDYVLAKLASSFAHIGTQMKGRAMCEVFGAYGWAEGAPCMKWLLDHLLVRGVNHFVPHAFSPEFPDPDCPPHFGAEGFDPQFEGFSKLMKYGSRAAHILSDGVHKADAAILYHADAEWYCRYGGAMLSEVPAKMLYDEHLDFDILPADCFIEGTDSRVYPAEAANGLLKVGDEKYGCLIVPYSEGLPEKIEKALSEFEKNGVNIIRMEKDHKKEDLIASVDRVTERDIRADGVCPHLRCAHYICDTSDVYMFVNESIYDKADTYITPLSVKDRKKGLLLDLLNEKKYSLTLSDGKFRLSLSPYESAIVVFDRDGDVCDDVPEKPEYIKRPAALEFSVDAAEYTDVDDFKPCASKISAANLSKLRLDPGFSGKIRYKCSFEAPKGVCGIDLGSVGQTVRLFCNGKDLGVRICPPYEYDLSDVLEDGENEITAIVSNTLANAVRDPFSYFMAIPASGITGPVSWLLTE